MSDDASVDSVRRAALDRIDRSDRRGRGFIVAAAVLEGAFLLGFVLLADFGNRVHVLVFLSSIAVYGIVLLGLFALAARVDHWGERILKGIELLDDTPTRL